MVEDIGLLTVRPGNVTCVAGTAMKQETVNPMCQGQEGRIRTVTLHREISLVLDV